MASYIEVKVGPLTYRHTFEESDAQVAAALRRFAGTMEPPLAADATPATELEDAVEKIIDHVASISTRVRLGELRDEQVANLEEQARQEGGLKRKPRP